MTPTPDDATDWSLMGPLYRDRIIELEASVAELEAEIKNATVDRNAHLQRAERACARIAELEQKIHLDELARQERGWCLRISREIT